jgi:hypothetical protein
MRAFRGVPGLVDLGGAVMAIDAPESLETMLARFGASLKAAGRRVLLARDGLDYINPDANNGANEPAEEDGHA